VQHERVQKLGEGDFESRGSTEDRTFAYREREHLHWYIGIPGTRKKKGKGIASPRAGKPKKCPKAFEGSNQYGMWGRDIERATKKLYSGKRISKNHS